jgi:polysaccharide biosynthesis protein PslG
MSKLMRATLTALVFLVSAAAASAAPPARSPIASVQDPELLNVSDPAPRFRLMASLGAKVVRVDLLWDTVARRRPSDPRDPRDGAYDWTRYDRIVDAARSADLEVLFAVWGTPPWAADPTVPPTDRFPARSTRPANPEDFGRFGAAVVSRYSPRGVRRYEAGNEPNLALNLRPQYERRGKAWVAVSPRTYSAMLTSFYREAKAVDPAVVIGGGVTGPAGEKCPVSCPTSADDRVAPDAFIQALGASGLRPPMDVYTHHPYPLTTPRFEPFPGASFIDLYSLGDLQRALDRTYLRGKPLWLTEFGFATRSVPEYRLAVDEGRQAQYLADAYARVRANPRVKLFTWYLLQDHAAWASGLLRQNGRRKASAAAFQLPFAAIPAPDAARRRTLVGQIRIAARTTRVVVERRVGRKWRQVRVVPTASDGSFSLVVRAGSNDVFRARWSGVARGGKRGAAASPAVPARID